MIDLLLFVNHEGLSEKNAIVAMCTHLVVEWALKLSWEGIQNKFQDRGIFNQNLLWRILKFIVGTFVIT